MRSVFFQGLIKSTQRGILGVMGWASVAFPATLDVSGWAPAEQLNLKSPVPMWLGDDAVIGRLACPAVVRLEGDHLKNAPLLLKQAPLVEKLGSRERWTLTLRPGLRWWSGGLVDGAALAAWLKENLGAVVRDRLGRDISPQVDITSTGPLSVKIEWPEAPGFGPYVLSGVSLSKSSGGSWECAGLYSMSPAPGGFDLILNRGYTAKYSKIHVESKTRGQAGPAPAVEFSMARRVSKSTTTSILSENCNVKLDIPLVTAIAWNPASPLASSSELRQALTMSTPRGEILRTAAGDIGSLISAPVLRVHPGYNAKILVRPYSLEGAGKIFEQAGFSQAHIGLPRARGSAKPAFLRIARLSGGQDLVEKIIGDSLASLGIESRFEDVGSGDGVFDAALFSAFVPWTSQDLRGIASTRGVKKDLVATKGPFPFEGVGDKSLDDLLDAYAMTLTQGSPDFSVLRNVHEKWFEIEPWTVLMAHQYCVAGRGVSIPGRINTLDPDWFRRIAVD